MTSGQLVIGALGAAAFGYMMYILVRVLRSGSFSRKQKLMQSALIVFVPVFGAMLVHVVLRTDSEEPAQSDKDFERQDIGAL